MNEITNGEKRTIEALGAAFGLPSSFSRDVVKKRQQGLEPIPRNRRHYILTDGKGNRTLPALTIEDCVRVIRNAGYRVDSEKDLEQRLWKGITLSNGCTIKDYYSADSESPRPHESK